MFYISYGCSFINSTASFRLPWALQAIPALLLSFLLLFCPESPRWLANHGHEDEAWQILAELHGKGDRHHPAVLAEYQELQDALEIDRQAASIGYIDLFKPKNIYRTHLAMWVQIWSQLTGMNVGQISPRTLDHARLCTHRSLTHQVMMYYINYVFLMAGLTDNSNLISSSIQC